MTDREQWLSERRTGIGASDAAAVLGVSPYTTNEQLWEEKTGRRVSEDISEKTYVAYGISAEDHLRALFALDYPEYLVEYDQFKMVRNPDYPFIFATLDGELTEWIDTKPIRSMGRKGVLEIKTTEIMQPSQWDKWKDQVPDNYYIQILHQLLATGWDFAILKAQIKWRKDGEINLTTRHYHFERSLLTDDLDYLLKEEIKFWESVQQDKRPNTMLPPI